MKNDFYMMTIRIKLLESTWQTVIHYSFITIFILLIIILPVLNDQIGTPPYWVIWMTFGCYLLCYSMYWIVLLLCKDDSTTSSISSSTATTTTNTITTTSTSNEEPRLDLPDEGTRLQRQQSISSSINDQEDDDRITIETCYNSSTRGIPPSSFLAPTINQSIRSSSLDYTPPPPAYYHDMIYPPSYRSTSSTKDDNVSTV